MIAPACTTSLTVLPLNIMQRSISNASSYFMNFKTYHPRKNGREC
jgi:hypothetical protein